MSGKGGAASAAPTPTNERLASALEFARLGCRVVPAIGKNPGLALGAGWQTKATTDESVLRGWFARLPEANVGILGDGAVVPVDVDDVDAFERFQSKHGRAPATPTYLTGGAPGRTRLLFQHPGGRLDTKLTDGVELRVGNLMSVVPPGVHPDTGAPVEWTSALDELPLAPMPADWTEHVRFKPKGKPARTTDEWARMFATDIVTGEGKCHPTMRSMAGYLVHRLGSGLVTLELLLAWNERHCKPPKPEREIAELVTWTVRKEAGSR
jgi:hypothetical protein